MRFFFFINNTYIDYTSFCDTHCRFNNDIIINANCISKNIEHTVSEIKIYDNNENEKIFNVMFIKIGICDLFSKKKLNCINIDTDYKHLYDYNRSIPKYYLDKHAEYEALHKNNLNFEYMNKNMNNSLLKQTIFDVLLPGDMFILKYVKLITIDMLINSSLSFKCILTEKILRTNKHFHYLVKVANGCAKYDDLNVYIYDYDNPFFLVMGGGSSHMVLYTKILFIFYYKINTVYILQQFGHWAESYDDICNGILDYYNYNYMNNHKLKTSIMFSYVNNIAHAYWNDLSGFKYLLDMDLLKYVDKFIIGPYDHYNIYNFLIKYKYNVIKEKNLEKINNHTENHILVKYDDWFMYEDLKTFVIENNKLQDGRELKRIEYVKNTFSPILTFNIRTIYRNLYNQTGIFIDIINKLIKLFPNVFIILDGFVLNDNASIDDTTSEGVEYNFKNMNQEYNDIATNIISNIHTTNYISLIGTTLNRQIAWLEISNYGIMQMGAGIFNYLWLSNKNALCLGRNNYVNESILIHTYHDFVFRQNRAFTTYINPKYIDQETMVCNKRQILFNMDYLLLYILRDLIILEQNNWVLSQFENFQKYNIYQDWGVRVDINSLLHNDIMTNYNLLKTLL
jgi:hypothetical protein